MTDYEIGLAGWGPEHYITLEWLHGRLEWALNKIYDLESELERSTRPKDY